MHPRIRPSSRHGPYADLLTDRVLQRNHKTTTIITFIPPGLATASLAPVRAPLCQMTEMAAGAGAIWIGAAAHIILDEAQCSPRPQYAGASPVCLARCAAWAATATHCTLCRHTKLARRISPNGMRNGLVSQHSVLVAATGVVMRLTVPGGSSGAISSSTPSPTAQRGFTTCVEGAKGC